MTLAAELASVRWVWASVLPAARRSHCGRVKTGTRKIQLVKPTEAVQQLMMERGPDAYLLPFAQTPPACHPAATPKCERKVVPGHACFKDKKNASEGGTIRNTWPASLGDGMCRKKGFKGGPKVVGDSRNMHPGSLRGVHYCSALLEFTGMYDKKSAARRLISMHLDAAILGRVYAF